ncbi:MAG: hypothetical protein JWL61_5031 [Gemmatimonadetes bacterium]|nr:hypothetical protein [Gemmatimonadota bacterium]
MSRKYRDRVQAIYLGKLLEDHRDDDGKPRYYTGHVDTLNGYVTVYSQGYDRKWRAFTEVRFIWNGREYARSWDRKFSERGVVTIARRFAAQVVAGEIR